MLPSAQTTTKSKRSSVPPDPSPEELIRRYDRAMDLMIELIKAELEKDQASAGQERQPVR